MAGPEIRGWEITKALAKHHDCSVMCRSPAWDTHQGIRLLNHSRPNLARMAGECDVLVAPWHPPFLYPILKSGPPTVVADLYDPIELELAHHPNATDNIRAVERLTRIQLRFADVILTAGDRQRAEIVAEADEIRPTDVLLVSFGLPSHPPKPDGSLASLLPGDAGDSVTVVWWGSIWRWFDALTALRALAILRDEGCRLRIVFTGGEALTRETGVLLDTQTTRELAAELGLLDTCAFFLDDWIPYERRGEFLAGADIGVTLHADADEAARASRSRFLDYLWCRLPCVLTTGDELSAELASGGAAHLVEIGDVRGVADALRRFIDPHERAAARAAAEHIARRHTWEQTVTPLLTHLELPPAHTRRHRGAAGLAAMRYYAQASWRYARSEFLPTQ